MSGSQRMRKSSPCSTTKQGPMRATLPVSSLLRQSRQGSSLRKSNSNSPTVSPTNANAWRAARISPDTSASSGQRSPGSLSYKAKSKTLTGRCSDGLSGNQNIRRTASLDTIYLKGQWPRDSYYVHTSLLSVDKSTQTEEWSSEPRKIHSRHQTEQANISQDDKLPMDKYIRQRLQRTNKESTSCRERTTAFGFIMPGGPPPALPGDHTVLLPSIASQTPIQNQFSLSTKASPMNIPVKPMRPPMRSSIEGLNQEIEGLVLKSNSNSNDPEHAVEDKYARYREQMTPEGHRAPLADLLRATRSVNTQTPATDLPSSSYSSGGSRGSTPDQEREGRLGTSPHINRFLAREPPDGCEKVNLKFVEDSSRRPMIDVSKLDFHPKPCVGFQLKPSLGSAFLPLQQQPASPTVISGTQSPSSQVNPSTPPPNP
ncbi:glucocorticoid-induced transcript 1 protein isoform X2 [Fopius arisanus]|uniref:Glcci1_1 protein n=1 Tax=Fopius arisanus TaxID=64838 RepID=A0A0C9RK82_9HYME|nr:PREDICTED: glucocorticoid-induced transcript 1 protein-like isoform X2 [Fopius arisanus]